MKNISSLLAPVRSKASLLYIFMAVLVPCILFAGALMMIAVARKEGFEDIFTSLFVQLLWILPLVILLAVIFSYPVIWVGSGKIEVRSILKRQEFLSSDITGYAEIRRFRKGKELRLAFRDGKQLKIHAYHYRNYLALQQALTAGAEGRVELKAGSDKEQARHFLQWAGMLFGASLLFMLYIELRLDALPLEARDLQRLKVVLAEKPVLLEEEEKGDTFPPRLVLTTREYPGIEFQIDGAVLPPSTSILQLRPGDVLSLLVDKTDYHYAVVKNGHPLLRLKAVDTCSVKWGNQAMMSLEDYNANLKAYWQFLRKQNLIALLIVGAILAWSAYRAHLSA
ncbi:MAG: hypothetical protein HUU34_00130 [Saprospiraceae bacterium]|nr:hypothetical protein [Saprospiraceae bacterium]